VNEGTKETDVTVRVKWWHSKQRQELCREWRPRYYAVGETVTVQGSCFKVVSMSMGKDDDRETEMQSLGVVPAPIPDGWAV
jgi:hypothetical protein